jgi:hypothetical protein
MRRVTVGVPVCMSVDVPIGALTVLLRRHVHDLAAKLVRRTQLGDGAQNRGNPVECAVLTAQLVGTTAGSIAILLELKGMLGRLEVEATSGQVQRNLVALRDLPGVVCLSPLRTLADAGEPAHDHPNDVLLLHGGCLRPILRLALGQLSQPRLAQLEPQGDARGSAGTCWVSVTSCGIPRTHVIFLVT